MRQTRCWLHSRGIRTDCVSKPSSRTLEPGERKWRRPALEFVKYNYDGYISNTRGRALQLYVETISVTSFMLDLGKWVSLKRLRLQRRKQCCRQQVVQEKGD